MPLIVAMAGVMVMLAPWLLGLAGESVVLLLDVEFGVLVVLYAVWLSHRELSRREG